MDETLKKLSQLPLALRQQLSSPEFLNVFDAIEARYGLKTIVPFIQMVVGETSLDQYISTLATTGVLQTADISDIRQRLTTLLSAVKKTPSPAPAKTVPPPTAPSAASPIVFSTDDDAEINQYKNEPVAAAPNYEQLADTIISDFGYTASDEMLLKRLKNNIVARLRGVRDNIEARDVLEKNKKVGGLEFTPEQATALLRLVAQHLPQATALPGVKSPITFPTPRPFAPSGRVSLQVKKQQTVATPPVVAAVPPSQPMPVAPAPAVVPPPTTSAASPAVQPLIEEEDGLPVIRYAPLPPKAAATPMAPKNAPPKPSPISVSPPVPVSVKVSPVPPNLRPQPNPVVVESVTPDARQESSLPPPQPAPYVAPPPPKAALATSRKPSLDGVKLVKQSLGPIDELAAMTLIDFRRLASDPQAAVDEVYERIELLGQDGYGKRLEGIAAWQMSEVSRFYRLLGQTSLNNSQSITEVITERLKLGKPTLSLPEFEAVMGLNEKLRY